MQPLARIAHLRIQPIPAAYEILENRCKDLPHVQTYHLALSDRNGTAQMFVSQGASRTDSSSLLAPSARAAKEWPEVRFGQRVDVPTLRLDDWAEQNDIDRIDLMWLDMQGYELTALKHGTKLLAGVSAVHMEVSRKGVYEGAPLYPEVREWMATQGLAPVKEAFFGPQGNVLFVRERRGII